MSQCFCFRMLTFFKINSFRNFFQEHYQSVKWFGSKSGPTDPDLGPNYLERLSADYKMTSHCWYRNRFESHGRICKEKQALCVRISRQGYNNLPTADMLSCDILSMPCSWCRMSFIPLTSILLSPI